MITGSQTLGEFIRGSPVLEQLHQEGEIKLA